MPQTSAVSFPDSVDKRRNTGAQTASRSALDALLAQSFKKVLRQVQNESIQDKARTREEALVSYCRHLNNSGKIDEAWEIAAVLTTRVRGRIARTLTVWRLTFPPALAEELIEEIMVDFYTCLFDKSSSANFWEARFWVAFDRNLLDIVRRRRKQLDQFPAFDQSDQANESEPPQKCSDSGTTASISPLANPETAAIVSEALLALPEPVRNAYWLKHYAGFTEEAAGDGPTIASILGVSGRTVRNYMRKAEDHLKNWRREPVSNDAVITGGANG